MVTREPADEVAFESGVSQEGWAWSRDPEGERKRIEFGNAYADQIRNFRWPPLSRETWRLLGFNTGE